MDLEGYTPAQSRVLRELLAVDGPRPPVDLGLAGRLRERIDEGIADAVGRIPDGDQLRLHKSSLAALSCDGRFLDRESSAFSWSIPVFRGKLAHRAVELDWRSDRRLDPDLLVGRAWDELAEELRATAFLETLDAVDRASLRTEAHHLVTEMRDSWPPIPRTWSPRTERRVSATFAQGAVQVRGTTDLTVGRINGQQRQMIVVDLKTGWRRPQQDRQDLRLYALLLTLKYRVAPFRVASYYVTEGAWDVEDVTEQTLGAAVRQVVDGVCRAALLRYDRPSEPELRLVPGAYCRWCGRAETCDAYQAADVSEGALYAEP